MPRWTVLLLLALLTAFPASASASDFTDYRIPPSSWRQYSVNLWGDAFRSSTVEPGTSSRQGGLRGTLSGEYSLGADSDPFQWDAGVRLAGNGLRDNREADTYYQSPEIGPPISSFGSSDRLHDNVVRENWTVSAGMRLYPFHRPLGFEIRGSLAGDDSQSWYNSERREESLSLGSVEVSETNRSNTQWVYRESAQLDASVGYGRVRDASPVFQVVLLEERLTRDGVLARPLSQAVRQKLAELFTLQDDFTRVHSLPDKFFWREVERLLREGGALGEAGLAAFDVNHAEDALVVARSGFTRRIGWFAGPVLAGAHQHVEVRFDQTSSNRVTQDGVIQVDNTSTGGSSVTDFTDQLLLGGKVELRYPLGVRTQFDVLERALVGPKGSDDALSVDGQLRLQHLIAERWFAEAFASNSRHILSERTHSSDWSVGVGGLLSYFLEDFCRLDLLAQQLWFAQESSSSLPASHRDSNLRVSLGVTLGRGRLNAPGLLDPVRALN